MKSKRNKPKQYFVGGAIQGALGAAQVAHGIYQRRQATNELAKQRATAPSMSTPEQYYENYKNAYDSTIAKMETDNINRAYAQSLDALQGAGGRAVVGGLGSIEAQRQAGMNQMLGQERQARMAAGQSLAGAQSQEQQYRLNQFEADVNMANQAFQAGTANIGNAFSSAAENLMYGQLAQQVNGEEPTPFGETNFGKFYKSSINKGAKGLNKAADYLGGAAQKGSGFLKEKAQDFIMNKATSYRMEDGGMMTEGDFSHKSNPIHLVQDGVKVGEATGGEFILNPKQAKAIANESTYAKKLFKRFAQNAKKGK